MSILSALSAPQNRSVSAQFLQFSFLLVAGPIGFLLFFLHFFPNNILAAGLLAVFLVNLVTGLYAYRAYREEQADWAAVARAGPTDKKNN